MRNAGLEKAKAAVDSDRYRKLGLRTAFVARPTEYGPHQSKDLGAEQPWDVVAGDFGQLADAMGCAR